MDFKSMFGLLDTYGIVNFSSQAIEKIIIDRKRLAGKKTHADMPTFLPKTLEPIKTFKPKSIFYLTHCFYPESQGGTERFIYNMAKQQVARSCKVKVFTYSTQTKKSYTKRLGNILYDEYSFDGIEVVKFRHIKAPIGILKDIILDDHDVIGFAKFFLEKEKPDIVHCGHLGRVSAFLVGCKQMGIPYIVTITDFYALCHFYTMIDKKGSLCNGSMKGLKCSLNCSTKMVKCFKQRYQAAYELLINASAITAPSNYTAAFLENEFPLINVYTVPHGLDHRFYINQPQRRTDTKRFVYLGKLTSLKGVHLLVKAFKKIEGKDLMLDIYGDGNIVYRLLLQKEIYGDKRICLRGRIQFDQVMTVFDHSDCVIIPSLVGETYNFVLSEARARGVMVIASKVGALQERIQEGINGYLFECGNKDSLIDAIKRAINSPCFDFENDSVCLDEEIKIYSSLYEQVLETKLRVNSFEGDKSL